MAWDRKEITAYLVDVDTGDYLDFQYNPNDIVDEKSTAYAAIKIPGMSHPRYQYVAGEPRKNGFNWGYFGSGPAQLSLAILLELTSKEIALKNYNQFKLNVISKLHQADFDVEIDVSEYLT